MIGKEKLLPYREYSGISFFCNLILCAIFSAVFALFPDLSFAKKIVIKVGTLAPAESDWMIVWDKIKKEIEMKSAGNVRFITYSGGVMGDEPEMIRKTRIGQLHMLGLTINGMKLIAPEVGFLDMPFFIRNYKEADFVAEKFFDDIQKFFEKRGFYLVSLLEQGFVYYFSTRQDIKGFRDLKKGRIWAWFGDPLMKREPEILGTSPIFVPATDVLTALETGLLDTVNVSPLACLSLQWCELMKVMIDFPYKYEPAGFVISKKFFDSLPENIKDLISTTLRKSRSTFTKETRLGQKKAVEKLRGKIKFVKPTQDDIKWFEKKVKDELWFDKSMGHSIEILKKVNSELENLRK